MANLDIILPVAHSDTLPVVRKITPADLREVLSKGLADFWAMPTHVVFLGLIYPIVGILLGRASFGYDVIPMLFPLAAGFAILGPLAAIGLYIFFNVTRVYKVRIMQAKKTIGSKYFIKIL